MEAPLAGCRAVRLACLGVAVSVIVLDPEPCAIGVDVGDDLTELRACNELHGGSAVGAKGAVAWLDRPHNCPAVHRRLGHTPSIGTVAGRIEQTRRARLVERPRGSAQVVATGSDGAPAEADALPDQVSQGRFAGALGHQILHEGLEGHGLLFVDRAGR